MEYCIVGYSWCPHYIESKQRLLAEDPHTKTVSLDGEPNRQKIQEKVLQLIGQRTIIGSPGVTSPQIVFRNARLAICIAGQSELNAIDNLKQYVSRVCSNVCYQRMFVRYM